jgi:hypothetical protein
MFTKFHAHKRYGTLRKTSISTRGMLKFTHISRFFTTKNAYENSCIENPNGGHML